MTTDATKETADRGRGRPPMSQQRRDVVRLQIAAAALDLFRAQGVSATSVDQIAAELEISTRTLWRYTSSKEACIEPLLTHGISVVVQRLRDWPRDQPLLAHLLHEDDLYEDVSESTLELVRLMRTEPGLMSVWLRTHLDAEQAFASVLAERTGRSADALETKVQAGMLNVALRLAMEHHAWRADHPQRDSTGPDNLTEATELALRTAIAGLAV
ncbi:TetR/AcrR family transcriptional regulator [Actinoalloteichus hymeniacidonis]|nr:TetR/AcrR family transcriptional regulator [Actinoalloteichus hymeniacidonis]MBB5907430.1 AcrR family transcriptional regulator [Actinoalloteichus hymeniacidonis]